MEPIWGFRRVKILPGLQKREISTPRTKTCSLDPTRGTREQQIPCENDRKKSKGNTDAAKADV